MNNTAVEGYNRRKLFKYLKSSINMNTTQKGNDLESAIFKLIRRLISQGAFFVNPDPDSFKIFSKKGYYSKDREKDIIFDIAVEAYVPGQTTYSMLILIECKNHNRPVSVGDVEKFYQGVEQVAGANGKGIIVSTNSFQEGAINFSKSKGMGLIRYYGKNQIKWELTRSPSASVSFSYAEKDWHTAYKGITTESYESRYFDCYCYFNGQYTNSLRAFFSRLILTNTKEDFKTQLANVTTRADDTRSIVGYRGKSELEDITQGVLRSIDYKGGAVPLECICDNHLDSGKSGVVFETSSQTDNKNGNILGRIRFDPLEIRIYRGAEPNEARERFTLAHELGHYLLNHSRYMAGEYTEEVDIDLENPVELGVKDIIRMEWQANYFAACLLLPTRQLATDFLAITESIGLKNRGFGALYLDHQSCNIQNFYRVTDVLKTKYQVSREVVRIRLKQLGLLTEKSGLTGISW